MRVCFNAFRCECKERRLFKQASRKTDIKEGRIPEPKKRPLPVRVLYYPVKIYSKKFQINYPKLLTTKAKLVLMSFKNKYIYYAIDDILSILNSDKIEQNNLLNIFYSTILFLYYNLTVIFFDIWIERISFAEIEKKNYFAKKKKLAKKVTIITFNLFYKIRKPPKKSEPLW